MGIDCSNMFSMIIVSSSKVKNEISDLNFQNFAFLTHKGPERHVSCLARHYFANARKMHWSCEEK